MNIYITLDYELFFGAKSGSVEKCIIEPTNTLLSIVEPYNIKFTCFVDAGYLIALEKVKSNHKKLQADYEKITKQIKYLSDNGHGIELHVHPHWEDSVYDGKEWVFNTSRYKLADFSESEVLDIITRYNNILIKISGKHPVAYRAGGWSAQPFEPIGKALAKNNIFIDSTVYANGYYMSNNQSFDFRNISQYNTKYNFNRDLTQQVLNGIFTEIPISSIKVPPFFFWRFVLIKLLKQAKHKAYGNGNAISLEKSQLLRLLSNYSYSVVSIDGYKASLIKKAFKKARKHTKNKDNFVLIGHPKAFTSYSVEKVKDFVMLNKNEHFFKTFF